jgi:hypothetical protein
MCAAVLGIIAAMTVYRGGQAMAVREAAAT